MKAIKEKAMGNIAMSNETDLDWLARNVHVWPAGDHQPWCYVVTRIDGEREWAGNVIVCSFPYTKIEREQWLDRRAELQNKPSWKDAPSWAGYLAQSDSGTWHWMDGEPEINEIHDSGEFWSAPGYSAIDDRFGEVLGDWRDTLERRPTDLSEQAVTERLQEATDNVLSAVPELKSDKYKFDPFISIEHNQEQNMKQDNGWFERGELPPVGVWCEASGDGAKSERCKIIAYHKGQVALQWEVFNGGCLDILELTGEYWKFRPIRTERELAIDTMCKEVGFDGLLSTMAAAKLYDAGYRKESK